MQGCNHYMKAHKRTPQIMLYVILYIKEKRTGQSTRLWTSGVWGGWIYTALPPGHKAALPMSPSWTYSLIHWHHKTSTIQADWHGRHDQEKPWTIIQS